MSKIQLPPQAYTHEVLANAYNWLKSQPEKVRNLATTSDDLVALYLQARRHRPLPKEKPPSAKKFSSELKNLAHGIKQFENGQPEIAESIANTPAETTKMELPVEEPQYSEPSEQDLAQMALATKTFDNSQSKSLDLDMRSQTLVKEAQQRLNLSSEQDALRMLLVLGYEKARDLFPRS